MKISVQTTTQNASLLSLTSSGREPDPAPKGGKAKAAENGISSALEAASKKADEDATVIAALREAVENGKNGRNDFTADRDRALADVNDYQKTANKLRAALGLEETRPMTQADVAYESASISTTTIEAEIGGQKISGQFVSFERVSYDSSTGLSARSASASNITSSFGGITANAQSASVASLYAGTGTQVSNLFGRTV
ncbi:hypothetical protein GCM10011316_32340 [Roseibium aquae]|uniref:Uncharacterized protein n=1 Tax=Roseibium aquae TaxID=1323746 RepID=A0A916TPI6_9HYPH|nr:hypothetical protein [Roseibium aquae]GGB57807.1 hypothetical protein GCM10011316_32340 [Roseibium aquae]